MPIKYNINKIFEELEKKLDNIEEKRKIEAAKKEVIKSPEDAPKTEEVAPATSKTTEDKHGGDEATKEIKDSINSVEEGENKKENIDIGNKGNEKEEKDINKENKLTQEDYKKKINEIFKENQKKEKDDEESDKERLDYLKKYIIEIIKKLSQKHSGSQKASGNKIFDKRKVIKHIVTGQEYKIINDKYERENARCVQFFVDTSGSNWIMYRMMAEIISILELQGYDCYLADCGNGFSYEDKENNGYYAKEKLQNFKAGKVSEITCPTEETAAKMANAAEFSIVIADFDGLSSICTMANLCQEDKKPYFLSTEDRYSWEEPQEHDWVEPENCNYPFDLIYDVSIEGNDAFKGYQKTRITRKNTFDIDKIKYR